MALAVMGLVAGASSMVAPSASAAGILPTTTTVAASPASSTEGDAVALTATVKVLGLPGLGVTPTGSVAFTASNGSTTTALGSANLGECLLKTCQARLSTSSIPAGSVSVKATYGGDLLAAVSSGSAAVSVAPLPDPEPEPDVETEEICLDTPTCESETITSPDGSTSLQVSSAGGDQTVTASLTEGVSLDCPGQNDAATGGALATFDNTSATSGKTIVYTLYDAAAVAMNANYTAHTSYLGCYSAPNPFNGYTDPDGPGGSLGTYGPATQVAPGDYRAQLSACVNNGGAKPCFWFHNALALDPPWVEVTIETPPGDPRFT